MQRKQWKKTADEAAIDNWYKRSGGDRAWRDSSLKTCRVEGLFKAPRDMLINEKGDLEALMVIADAKDWTASRL